MTNAPATNSDEVRAERVSALVRLPAHKETTPGQLRRPWLSSAVGPATARSVFGEPIGVAVNAITVEGAGSFDIDGEAVARHAPSPSAIKA